MQNSQTPLEPDEVISPFARHRLREEMQAYVARSIGADFPELGPDRETHAAQAVDIFLDRFADRPVRDNKGGLAFAGSLSLFVATRLLAPDLIVESGVHKGHSTWVLREARPAARILSFDVDLTNLVHRDDAGTLYGCDWTEHDIVADDPEKALAFFDDHVSHARRIREAHRRGFRWIVVDDNLPVTALFATGRPPVPTVSMLLDPTMTLGREIEWRRHGRLRRFTITAEEIGDAPELIEFARTLPDASHLTRGGRNNNLTLVKLRS